MTAANIAARLVAKHGHAYATFKARGQESWHVARGHRFGKTVHSCARVVLWRAVAIALGRLA